MLSSRPLVVTLLMIRAGQVRLTISLENSCSDSLLITRQRLAA